MQLVKPSVKYLPGFVAALRRGWSPDNLRPGAAQDQLDQIAADAEGVLAGLDDPDAKGGPVSLPDGSEAPRLPGFHRWIWRDGFCGTIGLRWQPGTDVLPPHCLGHIGYAVVPWRRGEGLATAALLAMLPLARAVGLNRVEITTDPANKSSIRVVEKAGGVLVETFTKPAALGGGEGVRYRIMPPPL